MRGRSSEFVKIGPLILHGNSSSMIRFLFNVVQDVKVFLLWHDPLMQGWEHKTAYSFYLKYRPSVGKIR